MWAGNLRHMLSTLKIRDVEDDFCFIGFPFNDNSINFNSSAYKLPYKMLFKVLYTTPSLTDDLEGWEISEWCAMSYWDLERACSILCCCRAQGRKSVFKIVLTDGRWKGQSKSEGTERGQELQVRERMATRGQTGAWWETVLTFSWRDAQCHSLCKSINTVF